MKDDCWIISTSARLTPSPPKPEPTPKHSQARFCLPVSPVTGWPPRGEGSCVPGAVLFECWGVQNK